MIRELMRAFYFLLLAFLTSCSTLTQMRDTLSHASEVIEENTQKMKEEGKVIEENTRAIREYTYPMKFAFPAFCIFLFLFNYYFYRKILNRLNHRRRRS